jgi:hypothetical protein
MAELGVNLQQDTLSNVSGGPIRTITAVTPINGVPTQVQMQVIAVADGNGVILGSQPDYTDLLRDNLAVLKDVRTLLSAWLGLNVTDQTTTPTQSGVNIS